MNDLALPALAGTPGQLSRLAAEVGGGGLVLGSTDTRGETRIELIRAAPTQVTAVCTDPWLARVIVIRVACLGATTVIATDRSAEWERFVNGSGGPHPIAAVRTDHARQLPAPSVGAPLVIIDDTSRLPAETYAPRAAWQTTIHVREDVTGSRALLASSQLVVVCRLGHDAAEDTSHALGLGKHGPGTLATLGDREVLIIARRRAHRVTVTPTPTELRML